jgi:RNA polymerase sigma factor (sigma-70 family)
MDTASLRLLSTLYRVGVVRDLTDGQLLERFIAGRDESAEAGFAALVERHGPMVLRVCRQILRDAHDTEDAFQATFLVLARRASSVRKRESLASWLYGVAHRVASRCQADSARRRAHERRRAAMTTLQSLDDTDRHSLEDWPELHEEIERLPAKCREAIVLCYLEGLTTEAAARRLACAQGTVMSRLSRGRDRLRQRLTRRGLAPAVGIATAGVLANGSDAAVPAALIHSVVQSAIHTAAGATAARGTPAKVVALTEGVLKMMVRSRLRGIAGAVMALGAVAAGMGMFVYRTAGARPQDEPAAKTARAALPVSRKDDPSRTAKGSAGELVVRAADLSQKGGEEPFIGIVAIDPQTAKWRTIYTGLAVGPGPVSPDGRYLVSAIIGRNPDPQAAGIWVYDLTGQTPPRRIFEKQGQPFWANDGRQVIIGVPVGERYRKFETWRVNADGSGRARLPIPDDDLVLDCSRDGTWLATRTLGGEPTHKGRLTVVHPDGTGARYLTEGSANDDFFSIFKISPDGRSIAYVEIKTVGDVRHSSLFVADIEGKRPREIPVKLDPGTSAGVRWSPDGSRLALNLFDDRTKEGSIELVDLDGSNLQKVPLPPGRWNLHVSDWQRLTPGLRAQSVDQPPDPKTTRGRYQALLDEYKTAFKAYDQARRDAKTDEDRNRASREKYPQPRSYIGRFLAIAESAPADPACIDALIWIVQRGFDGPEYDRAIDLLVSQAGTGRVGRDAMVVYSASPSMERLFRAIVEKDPNAYTRGLACLWLGRYLKHHSERVRSLREDPESARRWEARYLEEGAGKESFIRFIERDPDALMKGAEAALERSLSEFASEPADDRTTRAARAKLAEDVRAELDEIRNLAVGKPAPEIVGTDIDGQPFKLSDYRGKVILLTFWAGWCGAGRDFASLERLLAETMHGRPFVLLGVNSDSDMVKLKEQINAEGISARSWRDGGGNANTPGPIARGFNVHGWPSLYLLDARGIIQHKFFDTPSDQRLKSAIAALVQKAEDAGATPKKQEPIPRSSDPGYFPIAVWLQDPRNAEAYKRAGINLYVGLWRGPTEEQLTALKKAGMPVICHQNRVGLAHLKDTTIVGWMHGDEPDNAQEVRDPNTGRRGYGPPIPPARIVADYERLRAADGIRPVMLNLGQGVANDEWKGRGAGASLDDYPGYVRGADIVSFDVYPVAGIDKPNGAEFLWYVAKGVDRLVKWTGGNKPVWNCIECTRISDPTGKATPAQVKAEVWMALVHGSRGLIYFVHEFKPKFNEHALLDDPEMLAAVTAVNRQIRELAPVLNSPSAASAATVRSSDPQVPIDVLVKRRPEATYVFAVGMRNRPCRGTFTLTGVPEGATAVVLGEERRIMIRAGQFEDDFPAYGVHLYRIAAGD